jgi:hypothetical protein
MQYAYDPVFWLICQYEPETGESVEPHLFLARDDQGVTRSMETATVPIVDSEVKQEQEAFLCFLYKFP